MSDDLKTTAAYAALIVELKEAKDRIEQLEAALRQIASCKSYHSGDIVDIARAALEGKKDAQP